MMKFDKTKINQDVIQILSHEKRTKTRNRLYTEISG